MRWSVVGMRTGSAPISALLAIVIVFGVERLFPARSVEALDQELKSLGSVVLDGKVISRPYRFSGIGSDTLRLNNVPYEPMRERVGRRFEPPLVMHGCEFDLVTAAEQDRLQEEIRAALANMEDSPFEERLQIIEGIYRKSSAVQDVRVVREREVHFKFKRRAGLGEFIATPPRTRRERHQLLIDEFWRSVERGTMIVRGLGYEHLVSASKASTTLQLMARIQRGESLSSDGLDETVLSDESVVMDVLAAAFDNR